MQQRRTRHGHNAPEAGTRKKAGKGKGERLAYPGRIWGNFLVAPEITMSSVGITVGHRTKLVLRSKVLIVGDACVGKSSVAQLFFSNGATYPKTYMMVR